MGRQNSYTGICYRCGAVVEKGQGFIEKVGFDQWKKWKVNFSTKWLVQHHACANLYRGTNRHYRHAPDVPPRPLEERELQQAITKEFTDQLSAYRARRVWPVVLASHFLIEPGRDYELRFSRDLESGAYLLGVTFTSPCGRYAFWRMVNGQSPLSAAKLGSVTVKTAVA